MELMKIIQQIFSQKDTQTSIQQQIPVMLNSTPNKQTTNNQTTNKGQSLLILPTDFIVIDLETTGLSPTNNEIIEVSALKCRNLQIVDRFTTLIKPHCLVTNKIVKITGINNEMLAHAPYFKDIEDSLLDFIGNDYLIGHNAKFDINFLCNNFCRPFTNNYIDTLNVAKRLPLELENLRLQDLAQHFNIDYSGAHRAEADCYITLKCYEELRKIALGIYGDEKTFEKQAKVIKTQKNLIPQVIPDEKRATLLLPDNGYSLTHHYEDVSVFWSEHYTPRDVKAGNRVIFIQEPTNEYDNKAVLLMFVPQKVKFGYLFRNKLQDMVNDYINRGDKVVARVSYMQFTPEREMKIDIAFFKKVKKGNSNRKPPHSTEAE